MAYLIGCGDSNNVNESTLNSSSSVVLSSSSSDFKNSSDSSINSSSESFSSSSSNTANASFTTDSNDGNVTLYYGTEVMLGSQKIVGEWYRSSDVPYRTNYDTWNFLDDGNITLTSSNTSDTSTYLYGVTADASKIYISFGNGFYGYDIVSDNNGCLETILGSTHLCKVDQIDLKGSLYSEANTTNFDTNNSGNPRINVKGFHGEIELYIGGNSMIGNTLIKGYWSFDTDTLGSGFGDNFYDDGHIRTTGIGIEQESIPYGVSENGTMLFYMDSDLYTRRYVKIVEKINEDCYTAESYNEGFFYPNNVGTFCKILE